MRSGEPSRTTGGAQQSDSDDGFARPEEAAEDAVKPDSMSSASSQSSSDSSAGSTAAEELASCLQIKRAVRAAGSDQLPLYRHRRLGTVHRVRAEESFVLACGRTLHAAFIKHDPESAFEWPLCSVCFGKRAEEA